MSNLVWKSGDVAAAVKGEIPKGQKWEAHGVSIDSRSIQKNDLFVALKGPVNDAHEYVTAALAAGAAAAIVSRVPDGVAENAPLVFVDDTFIALENLGRAARKRASGKIVAVTGSVGKTGSKEMLHLMLSAVGETYANEGSFNNHWGVPLSLSRLPPGARYGVFELGMNHAGELGPLSGQVQPHVSLITNVEAVHLEYFPNVEAIADSKAEIFLGTAADGAAVLNKNNPHFTRLEKAALDRGLRNILSFGHEVKCDARMVDCIPSGIGSDISAEIMGTKLHYHLGAPGNHLALNSVGALLAAVAAGGNAAICAAALAQYKPPKGRGIAQNIMLADGTVTLIDESYNASPIAVRAAIDVLAHMTPVSGGRRIMVLGDMRELGATSQILHAELAKDLVAGKIDRVYCCGEMMAHLFEALPLDIRGTHAKDSQTLSPLVAADLKAGDIITVKGSKAVSMTTVIDAIKSLSISKKQKMAS